MEEHRSLLRQPGKLVDQSSQRQLLSPLRAYIHRLVAIAERDGQQWRDQRDRRRQRAARKSEKRFELVELAIGMVDALDLGGERYLLDDRIEGGIGVIWRALIAEERMWLVAKTLPK